MAAQIEADCELVHSVTWGERYSEEILATAWEVHSIVSSSSGRNLVGPHQDLIVPGQIRRRLEEDDYWFALLAHGLCERLMTGLKAGYQCVDSQEVADAYL